jgi:hypothetical protein
MVLDKFLNLKLLKFSPKMANKADNNLEFKSLLIIKLTINFL